MDEHVAAAAAAAAAAPLQPSVWETLTPEAEQKRFVISTAVQ
jgi:hypothetical protein